MHPIVTLQSHISASAYAKLRHACTLVTEGKHHSGSVRDSLDWELNNQGGHLCAPLC